MSKQLIVVLLISIVVIMAALAEAKRDGASRACGMHLIKYLWAVCPEGCEGNMGDLLTELCHTPASAEDIKMRCCPST